MSISIRFGRPSEREALTDLQRRASLVWDDYRQALLAHPEAIDVPLAELRARCIRVAEITDGLVGFSATVPIGANVCELNALFVEPAFWNRGIGRALAADAIRLARRRRMRVLKVTANRCAEGFYRKLGFVACGTVQTQFALATRLRVELNSRDEEI